MRHASLCCCALLLCPALAAGQATTDSAALVTRLGTDTLVVERFVHAPGRGRLEAEVLLRVPRTSRIRYVLELSPAGDLARFETVGPARREIVTRVGDSLRVETTDTGAPRVRMIAADRAVLPFIDMVHWPFELALMRLRRSRAASDTQPLLTGSRVAGFPVALIGADSMSITHPSRGTMWVRVDAAGRLLALDAGATTRKLLVERRPWGTLELDALAARWTAQDAAGRSLGALSGRRTDTVTVAGATIIVDHGTPAMRGRAIWGALVPFGQVWRTGANRSTHFSTDRDLSLGTGPQALTVPAGTYTLFSIPQAGGGVLIVSRDTGQAGTAYDPARDLGRVPLETRSLGAPVELFTLAVTPDGSGGAIRLQWDRSELVTRFTVVAPQGLRIGVDRRVELMAILFKLAGNREFNQNNFRQYITDIDKHFGPFREHEAVVLARGLREKHRVGFSSVMSIAIRVSDPPELRERVPFDSLAGWPAPAPDIRQFVDAARRFAVDSRAEAFFAAHHAMYDSANARLQRPVARGADLPWFAEFFGVPPDRDFVVVPMLANSETNFGPCMSPSSGRLECYSIMGHSRTDSAGFPVYGDGFVGTLVHEFGHGYANPLGNARRAEFERSGPRVHAMVADAMRAQAYGWTSMVNESLVRAAESRYVIAHKERGDLQTFLAGQRAGSWLWVEELSDLFGEYETSRNAYPTLASFMPRVVAYFDSLPERVPAMQRRYDALRPKIVSVSIANESETVDPGLQEIVVRFDRPVRDDGWSVVPVFGSSGPSAEAQERLPKITWKELGSARAPFVLGRRLDSAGTTFRLGVELAPGREYELQLNTPHGFGFRNADDGVPLAPYRIRFKTQGASGP